MAVGTNIWTWWDGRWQQGDIPVMKAADHGTWLGTLVFDGARAFEGQRPHQADQRRPSADCPAIAAQCRHVRRIGVAGTAAAPGRAASPAPHALIRR